MIKAKKRAYLATLSILAALGGLAFYANRQVKHFEINSTGSGKPSTLRKQTEPTPAPSPVPNPNQVPSQTPMPVPVPRPNPPAVKLKTFIVQVDQYGASPASLTIPKGYTASVVIKADKYRSGEGLFLQLSDQSIVTINPGETKTLTVAPETSTAISAYLSSTGAKLPYSIQINIE